MISLVVKGISGRGVRRAGAGYIDKRFLVPLHPLSNIKITKYFSYKPRFNCVFSTNNLPRIRDGAYDINLSDRKSKGTHWVSLFVDRNTPGYFDSLELNIFLRKYQTKSEIYHTQYI